jgi:hypothetical protein
MQSAGETGDAWDEVPCVPMSLRITRRSAIDWIQTENIKTYPISYRSDHYLIGDGVLYSDPDTYVLVHV